MGSYERAKKHGEILSDLMFTPKTPHFFKIVLEDTLEFGHLRMPTTFMSKYGNGLSSPVQFMAPDGATWNVELRKYDNGDAVLENGFKQFALHYSLKPKQLLVFIYKGDCKFLVVIFDITATEIEYPTLNPSVRIKLAKKLGMILSDSMFTPKTPYFFKIILEDALEFGHLQIPRMFVSKYGNGLSSSVQFMAPDGATWNVELRKSDNGDVVLENGFKQFAHHYSLSPQDLLVFKYEGNCKFQVVIFDNFSTEIEYPRLTHPVRIKRERSESPSPRPCKIPNQTTSADKNIVECTNESSDEQDLPKERLPLGANDALKRASTFESDNPFFIVVMQPSYINPGRKMVLPKTFIKMYLKEKEGVIKLSTVDGESFTVKYFRYLTHNKYLKAILMDGWRNFRQHQKLKSGDVCVFEVIDPTEMRLNVVIYRGQDSNSGASSDTRSSALSTSPSITRPLSSHEKASALERAKDFKSKKPFFKVVMQPAYVKVKHMLNIPYKFFEEHLNGKHELILQVPDGRTWVVKVDVKSVTNGQHKVELRDNWRSFVLENNLEVGDVCVFELIKPQENRLRVCFF